MASRPKVLLITPPFTQLNTPYPATAYLKGFLNTQHIESFQTDLGIEVLLELFTQNRLQEIFELALKKENLSENAQRILQLSDEYMATVDHVIRFLQRRNPTLAYSISDREFLPEASRFSELDDLDWAFGSLGIQDRARHLATLFLEDLGDFIKEAADEDFGFSRYAERLGMSATSFDPIYDQLQSDPGVIDGILLQKLNALLTSHQPDLVLISIPFPGNLFSAFRCGQFIKQYFPNTKISLGGGYPNTELRSLSDPRVFEFTDFITLDDGERPVLNLIEYIEGKRDLNKLKRTYTLQNGAVTYINEGPEGDFPFNKTGTPDYSDLQLDQYLSVIEVANPMHRLWSDGRWNKLTMAHGCYWKKCSFCDISLDYIGNYEPVNAALICDRMEEIISVTGETGFHFVDEAAPPSLMMEVALEIIRRKLTVTWWTNIRFEKRFTPDLCKLLKASGCIAVSGGLEVASDRLLEMMEKGVSVEQVAQVAQNFTEAGIMVHAYLMYGFPTQTEQETIDSLEMVRQMIMHGVIQSGFWHRFAMTAHSPVGLAPEKYGVIKSGPAPAGFAYNDLTHEDPEGADHQLFSDGLKKSLFNYMHGLCFDFDLQEWFEFEVPETSVDEFFIEDALTANPGTITSQKSKIVWTGKQPKFSSYTKLKKGKELKKVALTFESKADSFSVHLPHEEGMWLQDIFPQLLPQQGKPITIAELEKSYQEAGLEDFHLFLRSQPWIELVKRSLLVL